MTLKVLTLNVWNVQADPSIRLDTLSSVLEASDIDIVLLQEVSRVDGTLECELVAQQAGYTECLYSPAGRWQGRDEGLAILSRWAVQHTETHALPSDPSDMARVLQLAVLLAPEGGARVLVGNTHLAYHLNASAIREAQVEAILAMLSSKLPQSVMCLGGDFNDTPDSRAVALVTADQRLRFRDGWIEGGGDEPGWSFESRNPYVSPDLWPNRRIDYVFVSGCVEVQHATLMLEMDSASGPVSDHYGVLVDCSLC